MITVALCLACLTLGIFVGWKVCNRRWMDFADRSVALLIGKDRYWVCNLGPEKPEFTFDLHKCPTREQPEWRDEPTNAPDQISDETEKP